MSRSESLLISIGVLATLTLTACGSESGGSSPSGNGDVLTVKLDDGVVQGDMAGESRRFLKIPFAKPPVGDLRWKAPVKNDPWTGIRHETQFTEGCAQNQSSQGPASANEDCLYLNVWSPNPPPTKAPVMVWIHGGGNFAGSAGDSLPLSSPPILWYDGQFFASRHGIVLVSIEYRLGPLGFFAHQELASEGSPVGNQGLQDQLRALEWVRDNIAHFGGDASNVTIFGESAGSADVCYHVASPASRGLFQRAISESGGCTVSFTGGNDPTPADAADGIAAFTQALGCDTAADQLACLRGKSISDIMQQAAQPNPSSGTPSTAPWRFGVVVDGAGGFLPEQAHAYFDRGEIAHVPYLLGSNNDEGTLFLLQATPITSEAEYLAALEQRFPGFSTQIDNLYPVSNFNGDYQAALARVVGDSGLVCGTHDTARRAAKAGLTAFMYNFNIPWAILPDVLHVSHASEMSHVFGNPYKPDAGSQTVADAMNAYWSEFAKTGDPNFAGAPANWPTFAPDAQDNDLRLQLDAGFEILQNFRKEECTFWRGVYAAAMP